jgi:glycosyltransferase involved in cell wall biosynthesis
MRIGVDMKALCCGRPGISSFLLRLLADAAAGHPNQHTLVLFGPPEALAQAASAGLQGGQIANVPVPLRERLGRLRLPVYDQFALPAALRRESVDVFFCPYVDAPLACPVPYLVTVHDLALMRLRKLYPAHVRAYFNVASRVHARRARRVITVSEFSRKELIWQYALPPERVVVLPPAISEEFRSPVSAAEVRTLRERLGLFADFVLFTGGADPRKNLSRLFAAFAQLNRGVHRYLLVLTGDAAPFARYRYEWETAGLGDALVFTGRLTARELAALYQCSSLVVYPSLWEGCGLPLVEAVASGAPLAASYRASLPEIAGNAALYFDPEDVEDMAGVLRTALTDGDVRAHLRAAAARRRAELLQAAPGAAFLRVCEDAVAESAQTRTETHKAAEELAAGQD